MKKNLFLAALAIAAFASCSDDTFVGDASPTNPDENGTEAIVFNSNAKGITRADFIGATAAEKLGNMFVVEGTKGSEGTNSPSTTVVFDNYLVGYEYNSAGTAESNTNNWEYVGKETGITIGSKDRMKSSTWTSLHSGDGQAKAQTIKYWDYTQSQYDFIAWSTGTCEAVPAPETPAEPTDGTIQVSRIATGTALSTSGFTMKAKSATDLLQCYYTDIITVTKASKKYGQPVTLTFRNMAAKVRVALYETVPGYSVKNVQFYTSDENPTTPTDLNADLSANEATLFTMGDDVLPQSGSITVLYPRIGSTNSSAVDYNKASVTVTAGTSTSKTQAFGALTEQYRNSEGNEPTGTKVFLGKTLPAATFAGDATKDFYTAVIPNTNGKPLTLRLNYTLVSTDGSAEEIHVYGAKAVVPATYTKWLPNYAYTYIFKISDNTNGWTSQTNTDPKGLFPITFDAVVTSITDFNAEQTTVTTVATPSITTYQQGHTKANDEYSKSQKAGADQTNVKDLYVQVMSTGATPALMNDLNGAGKSLLFAVTSTGAPISEATVMDALQNRTNAYDAASPVGRNGITLTTNENIDNTVESIINGVDDQPIDLRDKDGDGNRIADSGKGKAAKIAIASLATGTYAYVYSTTVPSEDEAIYNVVKATSDNYTNYYTTTAALTGSETPLGTATAAAGKVYFVKNVDEKGAFVSYTFKQTKVGDNVTGLVEATIASEKASGGFVSTNFYFDVYNQNDGKYAVKVFKVVE